MPEMFYAAALSLLAAIGLGLVCLLQERGGIGGFLAVMLFGSTGVGLMLVLSKAMNELALQDIALTFAVLTGILGTVLALRCWPGKTGD